MLTREDLSQVVPIGAKSVVCHCGSVYWCGRDGLIDVNLRTSRLFM